MDKNDPTPSWKRKLFHELTDYWLNVAYLSVFFSVFALYRRLILAHHEIYPEDYFFQIIKALVIAKVIMIGAFLRIDRGFENQPLIFPVLYKTLLFTIWVAIFDILEALIGTLIHAPTLTGIHQQLLNHFTYMKLGGALVIFLAFIPFFAFKELSRVMGKEQITRLFFKKRIG
jgi:hypothetical protein